MCDADNRGRIGCVDLNPDNPGEIRAFSKAPLLDLGIPGTFDDSGVLPASLVTYEGRLYLFYTGYQRLGNLPYAALAGLAVSTDDGVSFRRVTQVPILERSDTELFIRSSPVCMHESGKFRLWYSGGYSWTINRSKSAPLYNIKYIETPDLRTLPTDPQVSIALTGDEYGLTAPNVWLEKGTYRVIYSIRSVSKGYRLGYGESHDGISFTRMDHKVGIDVSSEGWDSEMICFSNRIEYRGRTYLFYCGNMYGQGGLGYAELTDPS